MSSPDSIGQRFTQLIQHLGLSKNAFAQSLDKTATVIQHLVDERNKPGYDLLCKVFDTYPNVSKDWLLQGDGPMLKMGGPPSSQVAESVPAPKPAATPPAVAEPAAKAPLAPVSTESAAPVAVAPATLSVPIQPAPEFPLGAAVLVPAVAPAPVAPVVAPAPDPAYFTVALQTQYLQHQLALAEQRNQHLLEQQALMQQMVALLQRAV